MKRSYMDYAMSVIMGRALPDARDGLKPVHRRIIFAMYKMGNFWNKEFKKSARVVGDVIGKYHPHGDAAVYDAIVRMAQDFSLRYPLVNGQGNFGSIDGDPPAAMRYTEVRLTRLAHSLLEDIEKDTVDFIPNYDSTLTEPMLLPTRFPNLLANGASGIAVGMSTNIPPHNLNELISGIKAVIKNPDLSFEELLKHIPGPDFPTAGFILGRAGILSAYKTGRGIIQMRARTHIEKVKSPERSRIIVTEIPYQTNKSKIIERIAHLVQTKVVDGISDIRDETDREGIRIVIELKRGENPEVVLNQLFKHTQLQTSFGIILLAVLNNQPKIFSLKQLIDLFIHFRLEVIVRRSQFELRKAKARAHILEGFKIILDHLDEAIAMIRASRLPSEARSALMKRFQLSETQAQAILEMRLQRLTGLEREKILAEYRDIIQTIARLEEILANEGLRKEIIIEELDEIDELFLDPRRTEIIDAPGDIGIEDIIAEEDMLVTISYRGYIKRVSPRLYRSQNRGGKGRIGMNIKDEDFVAQIFTASTHDFLLFFTDAGRVYAIKVHELPYVGPASRGRSIVNLINLKKGEKVSTAFSMRDFESYPYVLFITRRGTVKKTSLSAYRNIHRGGILALNLNEGDSLVKVLGVHDTEDVVICSHGGKAIRFSTRDIRPTGRTATGVRAIRLEKDDYVIGMDIVQEGATLLTVTERGYGKRSPFTDYRNQSRGGSGVINLKITPKVGYPAGVLKVEDEDGIVLITSSGKLIRLQVKDVPVIGRNTQGVKLINIEEGESVTSITKLEER